jgi:2-keto-4-pentenoate hydratase/2-oxohepta-3-ene-1,7-dioic acid hydratase in catechol pathway
MKICRFIHDGKINNGVVKDDVVFLFENFDNPLQIPQNLNPVSYLKTSEVKFLPLVTPSKIVCVGRNYAEHAAELGNKIPREPLLFLKAPTSIITDDEVIIIPKQSIQVEHEGELAVVIGRDCKNLTEKDNPFDYVFGFICLNDVTARDLQHTDVQFTRAKSFDTFCPVGASIETELDVSDLRITTKVNEVIKQNGRTSQMVFSVPFLIRYITNQMTLRAGDIIATGTPSGVSKLNDGDVCEVEIEGIGFLRNTVRG